MTREAFLEAFEKKAEAISSDLYDLPDNQGVFENGYVMGAIDAYTLLQSEQSGLREALVHARCLLTDSQWELVLHHIGMQAYIDKYNPSEAIALVKAALQVSTPPKSWLDDLLPGDNAEAKPVPPEASSPGAESEKAIIDLMDALKASIASAKARDAQKRKSHRYRK